jgi:5-methylcytosine-specific restriction endonuclease McrA
MPIKPENRCRYPKNWKTDIRPAILARAQNRCELCGAMDRQPHPISGALVILTIAHLDHTPENCDFDNLRALCQKCHNKYDAPHRAETRKRDKL